jgi:hypothetical protein
VFFYVFITTRYILYSGVISHLDMFLFSLLGTLTNLYRTPSLNSICSNSALELGSSEKTNKGSTNRSYVIDENLIKKDFDDEDDESSTGTDVEEEEDEDKSLLLNSTNHHDEEQQQQQQQQQRQPTIEMNVVLVDRPIDPTVMALLEGNDNNSIDNVGNDNNNNNNNVLISSSTTSNKKRLIEELSG